MAITPEQKFELAKFPAVLRSFIETELAAGNTIVEVGHSFPAPPAGAYIKLAKKVSTRERANGDGLSFYERNSSSYSGEFTDANRFYFVIEPAINPDSSHALPIEELATGAKRVLHFKDTRPPHEVQFAIEREIRTLFTPSMEDSKLCLRAKAFVVGVAYDFLLCFEAISDDWNFYSFCADFSWGETPSDHADYYRRTSESWFASWTRDFVVANRPLVNEGFPERYRQLCEEGMNAERELGSVAAIQQAIIKAMKDGASFGDSHKEGGTTIYWIGGRFVRLDYGDHPDARHFSDEVEFLKMLRQFCYWDVTRNSGKDQLSEIDTWRLILRQMEPS